MNEYSRYDSRFRLLISFVFRFFIVGYGLIIFFISVNRLPNYFYYIEFAVYIIAFLFLFAKGGALSKLRLLNDFLFIGLILYGKSLNSILNTIFLFLPIFNAPNHSGAKRSDWVYLLTLIVILVSDKESFSYWHIIPVLVLWLLSMFEKMRFHLNMLTQDLMAVIDKYDVKNFKFGNTHKVYRDLINAMNSSKLSKVLSIDKIVCFFLKENRELILYNSSAFIKTFSVNLSDQNFNDLILGKPVTDVEIIIDKTSRKENIYKLVKVVTGSNNDGGVVKTSHFIFCIIVHKGKVVRYEIFKGLILSYFLPIFVRIARLIKMEIDLRTLRDKELLKIKNKLEYVNNALLAMHFIRNKLTPIQNSIRMSLDNPPFKDKNSIEKWELTKNRDMKISESAIQEIRRKTNYILESEDNPFKIKEVYSISLGKIYFVIRRIWLNHFTNESIIIDIESSVFLDTILKLNDEAIEIVFTDIISNSSKYCENPDNAKITFSEKGDYVIIDFENDVKSRINIEELSKLVDSFNTKEFSVINRKTHGLKIVKEFLDQMSVGYKMELAERKIHFQLQFKKVSK